MLLALAQRSRQEFQVMANRVSQFPDPATSARIYRRNSQFYNTQPDNTAVIWYAAEQAKKAAQTAGRV